jgi:hypothetical protein
MADKGAPTSATAALRSSKYTPTDGYRRLDHPRRQGRVLPCKPDDAAVWHVHERNRQGDRNRVHRGLHDPQVGHIGLIRLVVVRREPNRGGGCSCAFWGEAGGMARDAPAIAVTVAGVPEDRPDEQVARHIVRHALPSVTVVTQHEDGSRDSMVDALITYPDGRTAAPEIVGDYDRVYRVVSERLTREGQVLDAPTLKYSWRITVEDTARIRELRAGIVDLLEFVEAEPTPRELVWPDGARWNDAAAISDAFTTLGVQHARPDRFPGSSPKVVISARILIRWEGDPNALPGWAVQFLTDTAPDVPRKLAASGYPERHAFIWATVTTPYEIASIQAFTRIRNAFHASPRRPSGTSACALGSSRAQRRAELVEVPQGEDVGGEQ